MLVRSHRHFELDVEPDVLWASLADVQRYQTWWPWLRRFDAEVLAPGEVWSCEVRPPTGYTVRFALTLEEVRPTEGVAVTIGGDIAGTARLQMAPAAASRGTAVELVSELRPNSRWLGALAFVARPLVHYGHDWVLDRGADEFMARALDRPQLQPEP